MIFWREGIRKSRGSGEWRGFSGEKSRTGIGGFPYCHLFGLPRRNPSSHNFAWHRQSPSSIWLPIHQVIARRIRSAGVFENLPFHDPGGAVPAGRVIASSFPAVRAACWRQMPRGPIPVIFKLGVRFSAFATASSCSVPSARRHDSQGDHREYGTEPSRSNVRAGFSPVFRESSVSGNPTATASPDCRPDSRRSG